MLGPRPEVGSTENIFGISGVASSLCECWLSPEYVPKGNGAGGTECEGKYSDGLEPSIIEALPSDGVLSV